MSSAPSFLLSYLLNSVWQIPLVFAAAWLVARALRSAGPAIEHRIWVSALLLQSLLPACSLSVFAWLRQYAPWPHLAGPAAQDHVSVQVGPGAVSGMLRLAPDLLSAIAAAFGLLLVYFAARLLWRTGKLSVLRRTASPISLSGEAADFWARCSIRFGVGNATLASSPEIFGPVTIGIRRKMLLLPTAMIGTLSAVDFETVIAHEFAHMHRQDFARNLLYEVLTLPASYHPILWLTREHVIETREMICDLTAAGASGQVEYARSLLRLASLLVQRNAVRTPHAIGIFDAHTFERRLMKLTETPQELRGMRRIAVVAACLVFATATCASALALHLNVGTAGATTGDKPAPPSAVKIPSGVLAGNLISHVNPTYPPDAKKAKVQGAVVLHAIIGKTGTIESLTVVSGPEELRRSSIEAVHQWVYKPYLLNGEPVDVDTTITVNYQLQP